MGTLAQTQMSSVNVPQGLKESLGYASFLYCHLLHFLLGMLLAPSSSWENANDKIQVDLNSGCVVYSNSLIPGPEMTETTSFLSFDLIA